ncbi:MarR family winged helix-turn-helix transcriptional regulator [Microbacterium halotolerans]|uniref:MarR family winged helix-turn-helix transcriptional regulator n=1 Tax=Microbacterium halotolerans TaxID=246613 RepID=UPI000E6ADB65|nr:MarR family winged helix-turn-helix transcriptional regulator [Microbacterium halotolerans]
MASVEPAEIDIATLAQLTAAAANRHLLTALRALGHPDVRASHGYLLQHLINGDPTVSDLADQMRVTQQRASAQVRELEHLGYVTRRTDMADNRVRRISLTARGEDLIADGRHVRAQLNAVLIDAAGEDSVHTTAETLSRLLDAVGGAEQIRRRSAPLPED